MRSRQRGVTLVEVVVVLLAVGILIGGSVPTVGAALEGYRATGATADLYAAVFLTKARARASGVMHALVIEPDGQAFRIVADPFGAAQTVDGPHRLVDGAVATSNIRSTSHRRASRCLPGRSRCGAAGRLAGSSSTSWAGPGSPPARLPVRAPGRRGDTGGRTHGYD